MNIVVMPVLFEGEVKAVIELASFYRFSDIHLTFLNQLTEGIGIVLNTITATMRTEELLKQSQSLAGRAADPAAGADRDQLRLEAQARTLQASEERLKQQQEELQQTNEELEEKASSWPRRTWRSRRRTARSSRRGCRSREGRAARAHLEVQVRVPRQHVARAAHAAQQPADPLEAAVAEPEENLNRNRSSSRDDSLVGLGPARADQRDPRPVEIESGTMDVDAKPLLFAELQAYVERAFKEVATSKGLDFGVSLAAELPPDIETDPKRLQQVLKNLLSNALKFTDKGSVPARHRGRGGGLGRRPAHLEHRPGGDRLQGDRHRHRHSGRQAPHHLRGVPAGRRHHQPASTAAPASGCRSAGKSPGCWGRESG
jgi:signal transduction histidine kinase